MEFQASYFFDFVINDLVKLFKEPEKLLSTHTPDFKSRIENLENKLNEQLGVIKTIAIIILIVAIILGIRVFLF